MEPMAERLKNGLSEEELSQLDAVEFELFVKDFIAACSEEYNENENVSEYRAFLKADHNLHSLIEFTRKVLGRLGIAGSCDPLFAMALIEIKCEIDQLKNG